MLERIMALLGLVDRDEEEFEEEDAERTNGLEEREERILRPLRSRQILFCFAAPPE